MKTIHLNQLIKKLLMCSLLSLGFFQSGCKIDYLTPELVENFGQKTKGIQVYLDFRKDFGKLTYTHQSEVIENHQDITFGKAKEEHTIRVKKREISFENDTPGVILNYSKDSITVDFGANILLHFNRESGKEWYRLAQDTLTVDGIVYIKAKESPQFILLSINYDKIIKKQNDFESKKAPGKVIE